MPRWLHCVACGRAFGSPEALQDHVEAVHDLGAVLVTPQAAGTARGPVKCYVCGLLFEDPGALARHDRWAHPEPRPELRSELLPPGA